MYDTRILGLLLGFRGIEVNIDLIAGWRDHHEGDDNRAAWLESAKDSYADILNGAENRVDLATSGVLTPAWFASALVTAKRSIKVAERLASPAWDTLDVDGKQAAEWRELRERISAIIEEVDATRPFVSDAPPVPATVAEQAGLTKEAKALAALTDNPGYTDEQIAEAAGCNRNSLYRMDKFMKAKAMLKAGNSVPRGTKDKKSGKLEAWDEDRDEDE